ncbi:uncharacterized protein LOC106097518 isoform X1 [Oreochromis niloticus]|uniref:Uncharacterized LOC106097518 n=1 Tax=Oreochromis niloticus TaxID=8128 RepID=I3IX67_ORENI|nr:uncharacterized protein LOC106097518 isoform X1 [Oreochromis niloticus]
MRNIFYLYLMLSIGRCSDEQIFETKIVRVGKEIKLTCPRREVGTLFWIKLVSGDFPKILGRSFTFQSGDQRIRTATETGAFVLYITEAQQSDTGVYFCMKTGKQDFKILSGIFLKVEGPKPAFSTAPPSDPVHEKPTFMLQCSVLHDCQNKACPAADTVFCLNAKSQKFHSTLNYTHINGGAEYEKNLDGLSIMKCFSSYLRNFSTFDSQTYYCATATCVESFSEDTTKGDTEVNKNNIVLYLLCATLAISLIVIASLIYSIKNLKRQSYVDCNAAVGLQTNVIPNGDQENLQVDSDSVVYSLATYKKVSKSRTTHTKTCRVHLH